MFLINTWVECIYIYVSYEVNIYYKPMFLITEVE